MPWRPRMMPPVGKSGPGMMLMSSSIVSDGLSISATQASMTSPRLCGGMLVAMPTAMPPAPLTRRFGNFAGRTDGSLVGVVVVRLEIDGILVDVVEQIASAILVRRDSVYRIGGRRITVDRAEIALAVDQRHAHGEILRHAHHRVVDRLVAVRMIFTDDVADDARRFDVLLVRRVPLLVHRVQDAPVHRLQAVARIGQRARHDHAHGVIEVGAFHLVEDGDGANI